LRRPEPAREPSRRRTRFLTTDVEKGRGHERRSDDAGAGDLRVRCEDRDRAGIAAVLAAVARIYRIIPDGLAGIAAGLACGTETG